MKDKSIRHKIVILIMLITSATMLLAGATFVTSEWLNFRQKMVVDLSTLASLLADNSSAALYFDDPHDANNVLSSLKAMDQIEYAAIFRPDSSLFTTYSKDKNAGAKHEVPTSAEGFQFSSNRLPPLLHR